MHLAKEMKHVAASGTVYYLPSTLSFWAVTN